VPIRFAVGHFTRASCAKKENAHLRGKMSAGKTLEDLIGR
jgi:hypothetical protein